MVRAASMTGGATTMPRAAQARRRKGGIRTPRDFQAIGKNTSACRPPAPPKLTRANFRGSWPRWAVTARTALVMFASATRRMPSRGFDDGFVHRDGERLDRICRKIGVDLHRAAEKRIGQNSAEEKIRIGDGWGGAAAVIAGRPGNRAGRARSDAQRVAGVEISHRSAAGADGVDVVDRQTNGQAINRAGGGPLRRPAEDEGDVGARAAHVVGDAILLPAADATKTAPDHAAGRSRKHELGGGGRCFIDRERCRRQIE